MGGFNLDRIWLNFSGRVCAMMMIVITGMRSSWSNGGKVWASKIWILQNPLFWSILKSMSKDDFWSPYLEANVATDLGRDETRPEIVQSDEQRSRIRFRDAPKNLATAQPLWEVWPSSLLSSFNSHYHHHYHPDQSPPRPILLVAVKHLENNCATLASWIAHLWTGQRIRFFY